jgi:hypothetical protein
MNVYQILIIYLIPEKNNGQKVCFIGKLKTLVGCWHWQFWKYEEQAQKAWEEFWKYKEVAEMAREDVDKGQFWHKLLLHYHSHNNGIYTRGQNTLKSKLPRGTMWEGELASTGLLGCWSQ